MRSKYWKVHKDELHHFENDASSSQIITWQRECRKNNFIFINESHHTIKYSYMPYEDASIDYYKHQNYIYMGDFNLKRNRKEKLEKLKSL